MIYRTSLFKYITERLDKSSIEGMLDYEGLLYVEELAAEDDNSIKNKLWNLFEAPESGNCARMVSLISVTAIITSTTIFCIETLPSFKEDRDRSTSILTL